MRASLNTFKSYLSLVKFSHTIFAMPFALIGFFLGIKENGYFNLLKLILIVLCMIFARNAAMAFNRYIDRNIDKENDRTTDREIPKGEIKASNALLFVLINSLCFITTTFFINKICFYLSPIALIVILGYSFTKRFTFLCHFILGIGLSLAPVGAYLAVTEQFSILPILLGLTVLFWVSGFDIIYALQDEEFDKLQNLKSVPVKMGKTKAILLSRVLHTLTILILIVFGLIASLHMFYWLAVLIFLLMLIYQHYLIEKYGLAKINLAFFTSNGIASLLFGVLVITDILIKG